MLEAALWGSIIASSLLIGSLLTFWLNPSHRLIGLIMGFGAGTLISAVAYDLVEEAAKSGRGIQVALGMALGAVAFFVGDWWVERAGGPDLKISGGAQAQSDPFGILVGTLLDGVPESFILGSSLVAGQGVGISFMAAVFISNLPEAMGATISLSRAGWPKRRIIGIWLAVIAVSAVAAVIGYLVASRNSSEGVLAEAFAAGALLTMLTDTMIPEAFEYGGKLVGLMTVFGFIVAFALSQLP